MFVSLYFKQHFKKMKKLLILVAVIGLSYNVFSQSQTNIIRQKTIGGNEHDLLVKALKTNSGGYLLAGYSESGISGEKTEASRGDADIWLVKIDNNFAVSWQKTIGGNSADGPNDIVETADGGYLILASSISSISGDKTVNNYGNTDYWLLKTDSVGNILWQYTYGGTQLDWASSLVSLPNGNFALIGTSYSDSSGVKTENSKGLTDIWMVVVDSLGQIVYDKTIGGNSFDEVYSEAFVNYKGELMIPATTESVLGGDVSSVPFGFNDYWLLSLNVSNGQILSETRYGGNAGERLSSTIMLNKYYYLVGISNSNISGVKSENNRSIDPSMHGDMWIIKTDSNGMIIWDKTIGGNYDEIVSSSVFSYDNQIILVCNSNSDISGEKTEPRIGNDYDFWIVSIDTNANLLWQKTIGGTGYDFVEQCIPLGINHYILFGHSKSGVSGLKTEACRGKNDFWIVEINNNLGLENFSKQALTIYPNPSCDYIVVDIPDEEKGVLYVFTNEGRIVVSQVIDKQSRTVSLKHLPAGTYFVSYFDKKGNGSSTSLIKENY